jgi:hypothetical protein
VLLVQVVFLVLFGMMLK